MNDKERLSLQIYPIILSVRDTLSLPTHKTLEKTLYYSLGLLLSSLLSELLGFYTFISWQGCLICIGLLILLLWIERSENDALLRMYRSARVSAEEAMRRAANASSRISGQRGANVSDSTSEKTRERE